MPLNARPSKFGCFTCRCEFLPSSTGAIALLIVTNRARRVKCDETKPKCTRCESTGRPCPGYPWNAPSPSASSIVTIDTGTKSAHVDPLQPFKLASARRQYTLPEDGRLLELGFAVLSQDPYNLRSRGEDAFWSCLLPQLGHSITLVGAAITAFAAAYEAQFLRKGDSMAELAATKHYSHALQILFQQVQCQAYGTLPLVLACTVLAAMETLRRHQTGALTHFQGAINLFRVSSAPFDTDTGEYEISPSCLNPSAEAETFSLSLCRNLDLTIVSYSLRRPPVLHTWASTFIRTEAPFTEQASEKLTEVLHSCFSFAAKAIYFKYRPRSEVPVSMKVELDHHVASLLSWLRNFKTRIGESRNAALGGQAPARSALILQMHCLFALIYVSTSFAEQETAYDVYAPEFSQILHLAEDALNLAKPASCPLTRFCLYPGVIVPLRLAAVRCREPQSRRKAISLLRKSGIEGPFNGSMEAAMSTRIVQVEEELAKGTHLGPSRFSAACEIVEEKRVGYFAVLDESSVYEPVHRVEIQFSQRLAPSAQGEIDGIDNRRWQVWKEQLVVR